MIENLIKYGKLSLDVLNNFDNDKDFIKSVKSLYDYYLKKQFSNNIIIDQDSHSLYSLYGHNCISYLHELGPIVSSYLKKGFSIELKDKIKFYLTLPYDRVFEEAVNLEKVLEVPSKLYKKILESKGVRLETTIQELPNISFSKGLFLQIVLDLFDNSVRQAESLITINVFRDSILISDDGNPFPQEILDNLWKPFNSTVKATVYPRGLGLYNSKKTLLVNGYDLEIINKKTVKIILTL